MRRVRDVALGIARSELRGRNCAPNICAGRLRTFGFVSAEISTTPRVSVSSARHLRTWSERPRSATENAAVVSTLSWAAMEKVAASIRARATKERRFIAK